MSKSEPTSKEKVSASVASLKESLKSKSDNASDEAKAHADQLVKIGENFLRMRQPPPIERFPQRPHKLSLSVSMARILQKLKVMGLAAVAWIVFVVLWNVFTR